MSGGDIVGAGNVDKIRDILFGSQMREYERKFQRMEERMGKEISALREESTKRIDTLEGYVNKELEALGDRLKGEQSQRTESVEELTTEIAKTAKLLEKKIGELEDTLGKNNRDLRQQILDQSKSLSGDIGKRYEETNAALDRAAGELREDKVDRSALSEMLTELALRLSNDHSLIAGLDMDDSQAG
jgi:hypothetical protein